MKTLLTLLLSLIASVVLAQTAILTPQGNYLCLPGSMVTTCAGSPGGLTILPLGHSTYAITPMTPTMPSYQDEPKQPRESSTPLFLSPLQGNLGSRFEAESQKVPCYSRFKEC